MTERDRGTPRKARPNDATSPSGAEDQADLDEFEGDGLDGEDEEGADANASAGDEYEDEFEEEFEAEEPEVEETEETEAGRRGRRGAGIAEPAARPGVRRGRTGSVAAGQGRFGGLRGIGRAPAREPATPSETAVRINDRVSQYYVALVLVVFVGIFLYGVFLGSGGVFTPLPTPKPIPSASVAPSASASASPGASESASPSSSAATSASPGSSASPSSAASPSPS